VRLAHAGESRNVHQSVTLLEAIEEFGDSGFQDGLSFPAIPFIPENGLGSFEIASLLNNLPSRS
jgi:hypothetical protein